MRMKGLIGLFMLCCFTAAMAFLIRKGGNWAVTAQVMIAILGFVLGWNGVRKLVEACKKEHACYLCGLEATRYCDFVMTSGDCGRWACSLHMTVSPDGKRDLCSDHSSEGRLL